MKRSELLEKYKAERVPCEIWSRVMGYHRPLNSWNIGKQQEHKDRKFFEEKNAPPCSAEICDAA